ncbi:sensor histidine kinase [Pseudooceanicola sp. C21-150M6]|uniref:sensor histidine kinase n=1 Tax=Pseudooceanicola sp. C21-150M6 TaxID=3434355 RepID=UPI003D7F610B
MTHVLIIDDDPADRMFLKRHIFSADPDGLVSEVASVEEALTQDGAEPTHIFVDFYLPGADGQSGLSQLRTKWPRAGLILLTGQGNEEIAKQAILAGANDYASKGRLTPEAVVRMLRSSRSMALLADAARERSEDLAIFSEVLVHDIRSPIRGGRFLVSQIREALETGDAQQAREDLDRLDMALNVMSDLVSSLTAHIATGEPEPAEKITLAVLVERARLALLKDVEESAAKIATTNGDLVLNCPPALLVQLFQNVIGNAIKFAGGSRPRIEISAHRKDQLLSLTIRDHGQGILPEYRESIFHPFKRINGASNVSGTGLGLSTCRKIAGRLGGRIWCDPEVDPGLAIHVDLPQPAVPELVES